MNILRLTLLALFAGIFCLGIVTKSFASIQEGDVLETFTDEYKPGNKNTCTSCSSTNSCDSGQGATAPQWLKYGILFLAVAGGAVYISKKFSWKITALLLALVASGFVTQKERCSLNYRSTEKIVLTEIPPPQNEKQDEFKALEQKNSEDEFETFSDSGESQEFDQMDEFSEENIPSDKQSTSVWENRNFTLSILVLVLTMLAGILVRFKTTRKLKTFMLLGTMIYLGFINGACPCMISSFQNTILYLIGVEVKPVLMLWFLGLIPLTYFFGKVWCGWVCHLGALQEFIFRPGILKTLHNRKSQRVLKWIRISTLGILIVQILITRSNIFIHYDPFKVAYNLFSANTLGYVLLVILLLSSVLIYRPFCRALCPVGLILGWVSHIPGSAKLARKQSCVDCKSCSNNCKYNAMTYEDKQCHLDNEDCILCGDCIDSCKFSSLEIKGIAK